MFKPRVLAGGLATLALAALAVAPAQSLPIQTLGATVTVPRNSNDALAAALVAAGPGGTVLLAPGYHYESGPVMITAPVTILGQRGATLVSTSTPGTAYPIAVQPALHVWGTTGVTIKGLELRPRGEGDGNTAILIENATDTLVEANFIRRYQFGIIVQRGDRTEVSRNTIVVSGGWRTGAIPEAEGILNINGTGTLYRENRISNAFFAFFASDFNGRLIGNTFSNSFVGAILCRVPYGGLDIGGSYDGAANSATGWTVSNNYAAGNQWGFMVIDDAQSNTLVNNAASGNAVYDLELAGDSMRFGFFTPAAHENTVHAGSFRDLRIKDCGTNNTVSGGTPVDTTLDPCF